MNSLDIYEIKDIQNIITGYIEDMEKIDGLEDELTKGILNFEISPNNNTIRFEINIQEDITNVYLNDKLIFEEEEFIVYFEKQVNYIKEAIYHFIANKLLLRYRSLYFDKEEYYEDYCILLHMIFGNSITHVIDDLENMLICDYLNCPIRNKELQTLIVFEDHDNIYLNMYSRELLCEILYYFDEQESYIVRDNYSEICNFFNQI